MVIEGVTYHINWKKFKRGTSFFIPCLNTKQGKELVEAVLRRLKYEYEIQNVIEEGIKGLRIWRL